MEGVERYKVRLLAHNEAWKLEYLQTRDEIQGIWGENILDIQHVGSTAIERICAKPILDIAIRLKSIDKMDIEGLEKQGYDFCGARNEKNTYYLFVLRGENQISLKHIHCYAPEEDEYFKLVKFRDYLNFNLDYAKQYERLKISLAEKYPDDRVAYTVGKEEFIKMIYSKIN